jgi:Integrase zinc binding domain
MLKDYRKLGGDKVGKVEKNEELIYVDGKMYIPKDEGLRTKLMELYHDPVQFGHNGARRMIEKMERQYYWPSMKQDIRNFTPRCESCQATKAGNTGPVGLIHPLPIPEERFEEISMDFKDMFKTKDGFDYLLVIIDRLTKYVRLVATKTTATATETAQLVFDNWY